MAEITYYRWSATLPVILPTLAYIVFWHTGPFSDVMDRIVALVVLSGVAAGPAYVLFICALYWWLRGRTAASYRLTSLIAPLLFVPVFVLYLFVLRYFLPRPEPFVDIVLFYLRYMLFVWYLYVVLVHLVRLGLLHCGWFNNRRAMGYV